MRAWNLTATLLLATGTAAAGEPYRDGLPVPPYRLLESMVARVKDGSPGEASKRSLELAAPLVRALDQKYGAQIEKSLRAAIESNDRDQAYAATLMLVLLDSQDLLEGIQLDDNTGWSDAKVRTKRAFLDYGLVGEALRSLQPDLDRRVVSAFGQLVLALQAADMATPPEQITARKGTVVAGLVAMREELGKRRSRPDGGGGG
jgi:hypothetical protein